MQPHTQAVSTAAGVTMRVLVSEQFQGFLEAAPDALLVVGSDGRIVAANSLTHAFFGYETAELAGHPIEVLVPHRWRHQHVIHRRNFDADPRRRPMGAGLELAGMRKDGTEFPVEISLSPVRTDEGVVVVAAIRDLTERKRIERALQEKNAELERANKVKDHFLAGMSHEMRTPLNAIIGFTGTLLMHLPGPLTDEQEEQLKTVETSARHLLSIINDLLDLAKLESGKVDLGVEEVVCQSVVNEVASALSPLAKAKGLRFDVKAPRDSVVVQSNRRALTQVLLNLTNNAIKFTDTGAITLELARSWDEGSYVAEMRVADTGTGIRPEDLARLFRTFEQLDTPASSRQQGTGLGLYLSQRLAVMLGGRITVDSTFGKGSTFALVLPEHR